MPDLSAALPTFVITLREGVEASLVVGIVMAYLQKAQRTSLYSWVYGGIAAGLLASVAVGWIFLSVLQSLEASNATYAPILKASLEGSFSLIAVGLLSWMLVWMTQQAKSLKSDVEAAVNSALERSPDPLSKTSIAAGSSILTLVLIAVLREGFETVVFIAAQFQEGFIPILGAIAGLIGAVGIGILLFKLGVKINLRLFFQVMGVLLLLIVSGLVVTTLRHADHAIALLSQTNPAWSQACFSQDSCILGFQVWDASAVLPDRQFPGLLLKAFFGYTQHLYLVQAIAYLIFLITIGGLYFQSLTRWPSRKASQESHPASEIAAPSRSET